MRISKSAPPYFENILTETGVSGYEGLIPESEVVIENHPNSDFLGKDNLLKYLKRNRFAMGFLVAVPITVLLWFFIILSFISLV